MKVKKEKQNPYDKDPKWDHHWVWAIRTAVGSRDQDTRFVARQAVDEWPKMEQEAKDKIHEVVKSKFRIFGPKFVLADQWTRFLNGTGGIIRNEREGLERMVGRPLPTDYLPRNPDNTPPSLHWRWTVKGALKSKLPDVNRIIYQLGYWWTALDEFTRTKIVDDIKYSVDTFDRGQMKWRTEWLFFLEEKEIITSRERMRAVNLEMFNMNEDMIKRREAALEAEAAEDENREDQE